MLEVELALNFLSYHLSYTRSRSKQLMNTVKVHGVFPSGHEEFRIFTENSISLSQHWRQRKDR